MITGISTYGQQIKIRLVEMEKSQNWLIGEVKKKTGLYFDTSYLSKIMRGEIKNPNVVNAISEILVIDEDEGM